MSVGLAVDLVIARYLEDVSWLNDVPKHINICVYDKCDMVLRRFGRIMRPPPPVLPVGAKYIKLPNIGHDADTYLTHIIDNYDRLAEITIFTRGNPFPHSPDFIKLAGYTHSFKPVQPLTIGKQNTPLASDSEDYVNDARTASFPISNYNLQSLKFHDDGLTNVLQPFMHLFAIPNGANLVEWVMNTNGFEVESHPIGFFNYASIFAVHKHKIMQHPKQAYQNLRDMNARGNPFFAAILERMWLQLFGFEKTTTITNSKPMDFTFYTNPMCDGFLPLSPSSEDAD